MSVSARLSDKYHQLYVTASALLNALLNERACTTAELKARARFVRRGVNIRTLSHHAGPTTSIIRIRINTQALHNHPRTRHASFGKLLLIKRARSRRRTHNLRRFFPRSHHPPTTRRTPHNTHTHTHTKSKQICALSTPSMAAAAARSQYPLCP